MKHIFNFSKKYKVLTILNKVEFLKDDDLTLILKLPETQSLLIIESLVKKKLIIRTRNHNNDSDLYDDNKTYRARYLYEISDNGKNYYKNIFIKFLIALVSLLILPIIIGVTINYFTKFI